MTQPTKDYQNLLEQLHANVVQVQFVKTDGSMRLMTATLQEQHLPESASSDQTRNKSESVCRVWDMDKQAWRSFRWDSVQSWSIVNE